MLLAFVCRLLRRRCALVLIVLLIAASAGFSALASPTPLYAGRALGYRRSNGCFDLRVPGCGQAANPMLLPKDHCCLIGLWLDAVIKLPSNLELGDEPKAV